MILHSLFPFSRQCLFKHDSIMVMGKPAFMVNPIGLLGGSCLHVLLRGGVGGYTPLCFFNIDHRVVYLIWMCRYFNSLSKYMYVCNINIGPILLLPFIWISVLPNWRNVLKNITFFYKNMLNTFFNYFMAL